ncbi:MAG: hypothetical protein M3044_08250 [Thermoproteota archaeon]|nr:hypothetical protein [Thermoproteota archaeon]
MDQQKEEERRKNIADSHASMIHEDEKLRRFLSENEKEITYYDIKLLHGFFSQCEKCKMWVKIKREEEWDYTNPIERFIPLNRTAYGQEICDRCWDETKRPTYEENIGWIATLLENHLINPSPTYADIDTMNSDGFRHLEQMDLAGPVSSGPLDDDLRESLDEVIEFIDWKKNIFPKECKTENDKRRWLCVAVAREIHRELK